MNINKRDGKNIYGCDRLENHNHNKLVTKQKQ